MCQNNCLSCPVWETCSGPVYPHITKHCRICGRESDSFTGGVCDACREKLLQNADMLRDYAESDVADYLNYCAEIYGDMAAS